MTRALIPILTTPLTTSSQADLQLTTKIKQAGELLDLTVLDHIIITGESYYVLADEGFL